VITAAVTAPVTVARLRPIAITPEPIRAPLTAGMRPVAAHLAVGLRCLHRYPGPEEKPPEPHENAYGRRWQGCGNCGGGCGRFSG